MREYSLRVKFEIQFESTVWEYIDCTESTRLMAVGLVNYASTCYFYFGFAEAHMFKCQFDSLSHGSQRESFLAFHDTLNPFYFPVWF